MEKENIYPGQPTVKDGNNPSLSRTRVISEWPRCRNTLQLQSFLGLCNYYRCFVPQFSHTISPLTRYLKGKKPFVLNKENQGMFLILEKKSWRWSLKISSRFTDEGFTHQSRRWSRISFREAEEKVDHGCSIGFFQSWRIVFKNRRKLGKLQTDQLDRTGSAPKRQKNKIRARSPLSRSALTELVVMHRCNTLLMHI